MSEMALKLIARAKAEGLKRLDLGRTGISGAVPEEVGSLDQLEKLILSDHCWEWEKACWIDSKNEGPPNRITHLPSVLPPNLKELFASEQNEHHPPSPPPPRASPW